MELPQCVKNLLNLDSILLLQYRIGFVITACTYICDVCLQMNAVLLTISLGSLAKSELGRTSEIKSEMNEGRKEYLELGK